MPQEPHVFIITWCDDERALYGSTLIFKTLRIGFPDAHVTVVDNGTDHRLRAPIIETAEAAGCDIELIEEPVPHWQLVERFALAGDEPVVFVDPDIMFWESVQGWDFGEALLAGRLISAMRGVGGWCTLPRLHTSHLWIPRPSELRARIAEITQRYPVCGNLFEARMAPPGWLFWDTAAALYLALGNEAVAFSEAELDAYDHLFAGSHLNRIVSIDERGETTPHLVRWHAAAREDYRSLRGIWREQEQLMQSRLWQGDVPDDTTPARRHDVR